MSFQSLRILPPFAIARFGSSSTPLEAFNLEVDSDNELGFRRIVPQPTFVVDPQSGSITSRYVPANITFRDGDHIRPVAPFLEAWVETSDNPGKLQPLTAALLSANGLSPDSVTWTVEVANLKVFRRTGNANDKVTAQATLSDHSPHSLLGTAPNFLAGKSIPFGSVQYINPTDDFDEIRMRFTPGQGLVYGSSLMRNQTASQQVLDPTFNGDDTRIVYDQTKGKWLGFQDAQNNPALTNPEDIYQGYYPSPTQAAISWGYLDDVCDGQVTVTIAVGGGQALTATSWLSACMPAFAPDSQPMRSAADELEQLILGPEISDEEVSIDEAAEIIRRALETVRLINTRVMNGNTINGRQNIAHTLVTQDSNDFGREFAPLVAPSLVDNYAVRLLHERIYTALRAGTAPWFADVIRRPEEIGDMSDKARRKMPAMMRGPDGRALTLTRRQISKIVKAATAGIFDAPAGEKST